jgi:predicted transcriptional regulator
MRSLTVLFSDESLTKLQQLATVEKTTPEELVRVCVEEWLKTGMPDFATAADYVVKKNSELYRRLAGLTETAGE